MRRSGVGRDHLEIAVPFFEITDWSELCVRLGRMRRRVEWNQHRLHSHTDLQHERVKNMSWYTADTDHGKRCVFVRQVQTDITDDKTLTMVKSELSSFTARWELIGLETLREELQSWLPQIRRKPLLREIDGTTHMCSKRVCDSRDVR